MLTKLSQLAQTVKHIYTDRMTKITNLLNSPVEVQTDKGPVVLAPLASADVTGFASGYERMYRASNFFDVSDDSSLRDDYRELTGKEPDKRWSDTRIALEIEKLLG